MIIVHSNDHQVGVEGGEDGNMFFTIASIEAVNRAIYTCLYFRSEARTFTKPVLKARAARRINKPVKMLVESTLATSCEAP
jgi:hypothetical protein